MASGSGTGTAVSTAPAFAGGIAHGGCISLPLYAQIIEHDECRFYGVQRSYDDPTKHACREYWTQVQRNELQHYLLAAQSMIEKELRYPLCPTWIADEEQEFRSRLLTEKKFVIEPGVMASEMIESASSVDHTADPAVVGPVATAVTDPDEIVVYHPGTNVEILPQQVTIVNGEVTIWIPRCRMVKIAKQVTVVDYDKLENFESNVDIVRVYNDPSVHATLIWDKDGINEKTQAAFMRVHAGDIGDVSFTPANYTGSQWQKAGAALCGRPYKVRMNYRAGVTSLSPVLRDAVIRLANTLMPNQPCGCFPIENIWKRDRNTPPAIDRERLNCPFGLADGGWFAWRVAQSHRIVTLGGI